MGTSTGLRTGEFCIALGSPLGFQGSANFGIISAPARDAAELGLRQHWEFIQTDTAITNGNSGGPLINLSGEVIGVNTIKASNSSFGFAIPIDIANIVIQQLKEKRCVVRPYIGASIFTITKDIIRHERSRSSGNFPPDLVGVLVVDVDRVSPAAEAGIRKGDVIISLDNKPIKSTR